MDRPTDDAKKRKSHKTTLLWSVPDLPLFVSGIARQDKTRNSRTISFAESRLRFNSSKWVVP